MSTVAFAAIAILTLAAPVKAADFHDLEKVRGFNWSGVVVAVAVFGGLVWAISKTKLASVAAPQVEPITVQRIGELLMTNYVWPLQCVGVLLTAALIGALILVMEDKSE